MNLKAFLFISISVLVGGCNFFLGEKNNSVTEEIFEQGKIDPRLIPSSMGYVPIQPFFNGFSNPKDVYVGYDEMIYVIDDFGVHVLDKSGRRIRKFDIPGATDIIQDRRLHTYIVGKVQIHSGQPYEVAAVYHVMNTATASGPLFLDTIVHPYSDASRKFTAFRGQQDVEVEFTGLATLYDNSLVVSRRGPNNSSGSVAYPDNTILFFDSDGNNNGYSNGLNPSSPSIRSSYKIGAIASYSAPPQRIFGISTSRDFFITQYDSLNPVEFGVIGIRHQFDPDFGTIYDGRTDLLQFDTAVAMRFLYESYRFQKPEDIYIAPDQNQYLFVVDSKTDSLYQFTPSGNEGANPPANYPEKKQIIVSFGGEGNGPFNFNDPVSVCYNNRVIYIADRGNGRICRYKLSTDIE